LNNIKKYACFYVDEGNMVDHEISTLFYIKDEFLRLKFQAIKVELNRLNQFENNEYLRQKLRERINCKKFVARRLCP
jgi:hypothetical protein